MGEMICPFFICERTVSHGHENEQTVPKRKEAFLPFLRRTKEHKNILGEIKHPTVRGYSSRGGRAQKVNMFDTDRDP